MPLIILNSFKRISLYINHLYLQSWYLLFISGVPSTLNYVPLDIAHTSSPQLIPYPDWETNREGNCDGLTTTYRVRLDECDRLWVLDSGTVGIGKINEYNHIHS